MQNKNHYFLSVDYPAHSTLSYQVRADPWIIIRRGGNWLNGRSFLLLNRLQTKRDGEEEVVQWLEPPVDCKVIPFEEDDFNEPMLVNEEVQEVEEELQPYQWDFIKTLLLWTWPVLCKQ